MMDAVSTAIRLYREDKERWEALQLRGMRSDFGWDQAARQYENVLTELVPGAVKAAAAPAGAA
jgi:glycogen synthase